MNVTPTKANLWAMGGLASAAWLGASWLEAGFPKSGSVALQFAHFPEFQLEDPNGTPVDQDDFQGRYLLVFFGFRTCDDVCPTTLSEIGNVMDALDDDADQVQPLFISVDPERDKGAGLANYTAAFHSSILGLSGSPEATRAAAQSFHVLYGPFGATGPSEDESFFHSTSLFLLGPRGEWLRAFDYGTPAAEIVADLSARL